MGTTYLVASCIGLGTILVQLLLSAGQDASSGDFSADVDGEAPPGDGTSGGAEAASATQAAGADDAVAHEAGPLAIVLSLRFWTFALMAFGLFGSFLHFLDLAGQLTTLLSATALGVLSGWMASWTFHKLASAATNTGSDSLELLGQVGKVIVPPNDAGRSKVRFRVRGQLVDYVATADEPLAMGASVMVEEVRGEQVHVSAAPAGLEYTE